MADNERLTQPTGSSWKSGSPPQPWGGVHPGKGQCQCQCQCSRPHTYLHVWWARRPLVASRAAVLGSLLPADFPREVFERLLGFGRCGDELVKIRRLLDEKPSGTKLKFGFDCKRAFNQTIPEDNLLRYRGSGRGSRKAWPRLTGLPTAIPSSWAK
jgi:hypothetical protein